MVRVSPTFKRLHVAGFLSLFVCSALAGVAMGCMMNIINGLICPSYFSLFFDFPGGSSLWTTQQLYEATVEQDLKEGLGFGLVVAVVFTLFVFVVSTASCKFRFASSYLPRMTIAAFFFWFVGGLNGVLVGATFSNSPAIVNLGATSEDRCRFLWVGGSIYGAYFGGLIALFLGCTWFKRDWKKSKSLQAFSTENEDDQP